MYIYVLNFNGALTNDIEFRTTGPSYKTVKKVNACLLFERCSGGLNLIISGLPSIVRKMNWISNDKMHPSFERTNLVSN